MTKRQEEILVERFSAVANEAFALTQTGWTIRRAEVLTRGGCLGEVRADAEITPGDRESEVSVGLRLYPDRWVFDLDGMGAHVHREEAPGVMAWHTHCAASALMEEREKAETG